MKREGGPHNLYALFERARPYEIEDGYNYYDKQRERLCDYALQAGIDYKRVIAAFAALSPNASESSNYWALFSCIGITLGRLPLDAPVMAYPENRRKALAILSGAPIDRTLKGQKVTSFYKNTLAPDGDIITVDGHMLGAWAARRFMLRREAEIKPDLYRQIADDFREVAKCKQLSPPRFQAILWLTWKREQNILSSPQLPLEWGEDRTLDRMIALSRTSRTSYPERAGKLTKQQKGILGTVAVPSLPGFVNALVPIEL